MGICIEAYRVRIGTYVSREPKSSRIKRYNFQCNVSNFKHKVKQTTFSEILLSCLIWFIIVNSIQIWSNSSVISVENKQLLEPGCNKVYLNTRRWSTGLNWAYSRSKSNLLHYTYGNRRNVGYRYFSWNCDRGFLSTNKLEDVRTFAAKHSPHLMAISEVDLRKNDLNINEDSTNEFTTEQVHDAFKIEGYNIILPSSWDRHGKARIIVFASDEIKVKIRNPNDDETHIQNILLEVGFGRSKSHLVSLYYREWKSCVTHESSSEHQHQYLSKLVDIWRRCNGEDKEFIALGDMNLCAKKMNEPGYIHSNLSEIVNDFNIEEDCHQLVDDFTRIREVNGLIQRSCLDHVTVNCLGKMSKPEIHGVGQSDHLGIMINKYTKELRRAVETDDIEVAGDVFTSVFKEILDIHAPIKVIQNRKNYVPYISKELKAAMKTRDDLKLLAANTGTIEDFANYKEKRNEVTSKLRTAKADYFRSKFSQDNQTPAEVWKSAFMVLGKTKSEFPSQLLIGQKLFSTPSLIAEEVNKFFINKIEKLKSNSPEITQSPLIELRRFLADKSLPPEGFSLKEISENETKKLLKSLKGKKSCGLDWICGYSLKLASKEIVPELQRLINISIESGQFYSKWKLSSPRL